VEFDILSKGKCSVNLTWICPAILRAHGRKYKYDESCGKVKVEFQKHGDCSKSRLRSEPLWIGDAGLVATFAVGNLRWFDRLSTSSGFCGTHGLMGEGVESTSASSA
jgi:hypothetical protein